jgi:hypothetical protein
MLAFNHIVKLAILRAAFAINSTQLRGATNTSPVFVPPMPDMTNTGTLGAIIGEVIRSGISAMTNTQVATVYNNMSVEVNMTVAQTDGNEIANSTDGTAKYVEDEKWSEFYGDSFFGREGPAKICPGRSYITKWTFHTGNFGGVHKIGQVECSNGKRLSCCDGGDKPLQKTEVFQKSRGFSHVEGAHGFWGFKFCFNGRCAGNVNDKSFDFHCPGGTVLAGFKTKSSLFDLKAIQFFCRRQGYGGGGGDRGCGELRSLPSWMCPYDPYVLPPCFGAAVLSLCRATGKCRSENSLHNCRDVSVYVKIGA